MRLLKPLLLCLAGLMVAGGCYGQNIRKGTLRVGLGYMGVEANSPPGSCGCFVLHGGFADAGLGFGHGFEAMVQVAGDHAGTVPGTFRGLSTITLLAGPRYGHSLGRRFGAEGHLLPGAIRGFDAEFRRGDDAADTATAFALAAGGSVDFSVTERISVRAVQLEYLRGWLPNGGDGKQNLLRFGAGVVIHITPTWIRR